jgi:hypothetical protein
VLHLVSIPIFMPAAVPMVPIVLLPVLWGV